MIEFLRSLQFATPLAPWVWVMVGGVVALSLVEYGLLARRLGVSSLGQRLAGCCLRLVGVSGLLAMLGGLAMPTARDEGLLRRVVVLFDDTRSMSVADADRPGASPRSRHERMLESLQDLGGLDAWARSEGIVIQWRRLSTPEVTSDAPPLPDALSAPRASADLATSIASLRDGKQVLPLAGVLVISDGLQEPPRRSGAAAVERRQRLLEIARGVGVPISTADVSGTSLEDAAITELRVAAFGFVENLLQVEVDVRASSSANAPAAVELWLDDRLLERRAIGLPGDDWARTITFETIPEETGQFVLSARIVREGGTTDASPDNDRASQIVKILRDRVRVLHVAGRPDWDVRSLRTLLRNDPNVELLSYYILRDSKDIERSVSNERMSLIPFPVDELFREKLDSFDLIILQNFDASTHGRYMDNMAAFVTGGGSLVIIGGDLGLPDRDYAPLQDVLPTDVRREAPLVEGPVRPRLTEAGRRHPVTRWLRASGWEGLPDLRSFNESATVSGTSREDVKVATLLEHPGRTDDQGLAVPLLAVANAGRGRTLVLNTPSSWRVGFAEPDEVSGAAARPYDRLWRDALRWLLRDDASEQIALELDTVRLLPGAPLDMALRAMDRQYEPEQDVSISWSLRALREDRVVDRGEAVTDTRGSASVSLLAPVQEGIYIAEASRGDEADGDRASTEREANPPAARRVFEVTSASRELLDLDVRAAHERLAAVAEATGGVHRRLASDPGLPRSLPVATAASRRRERLGLEPIWATPWCLLLVALGLGGEWILRRRVGAR